MPTTQKTFPVDLRPDGTIRFSAGGRAVRLRRPTLAEFRDLRERVYEVDDQVTAASDKATKTGRALVERAKEITGESDDPLAVEVGAVADALSSFSTVAAGLMESGQFADLAGKTNEFIAYVRDAAGTDGAPKLTEEQEEAVAEINRESQNGSREFTATLDDLRIDWTRYMIDLLSESDPLTDDEVEQWMAEASFVQLAFRHLQTVPLAPGDS